MPQLAEQDRKKLDGILLQMSDKGASDDEMRTIANDFIAKYSARGGSPATLKGNFQPDVPPANPFLQSIQPTVKPQKAVQTPNGPVTGTALDTVFGQPRQVVQNPYKTDVTKGITGAIAEKERRKDEGRRIVEQIRKSAIADATEKIERHAGTPYEDLFTKIRGTPAAKIAEDILKVNPALDQYQLAKAVYNTGKFKGTPLATALWGMSLGQNPGGAVDVALTMIPGKIAGESLGEPDLPIVGKPIKSALDFAMRGPMMAEGVGTGNAEALSTAGQMIGGEAALGHLLPSVVGFAKWAKSVAASDQALASKISSDFETSYNKRAYAKAAEDAYSNGGMKGLRKFAKDTGASLTDLTKKPATSKPEVAPKTVPNPEIAPKAEPPTKPSGRTEVPAGAGRRTVEPAFDYVPQPPKPLVEMTDAELEAYRESVRKWDREGHGNPDVILGEARAAQWRKYAKAGDDREYSMLTPGEMRQLYGVGAPESATIHSLSDIDEWIGKTSAIRAANTKDELAFWLRNHAYDLNKDPDLILAADARAKQMGWSGDGVIEKARVAHEAINGPGITDQLYAKSPAHEVSPPPVAKPAALPPATTPSGRTEEPAGKQPWEKHQKDYNDGYESGTRYGQGPKPGQIGIDTVRMDAENIGKAIAGSNAADRPRVQAYWEGYLQAIAERHPEVLADYPELAAKYGKEPVKPVVSEPPTVPGTDISVPAVAEGNTLKVTTKGGTVEAPVGAKTAQAGRSPELQSAFDKMQEARKRQAMPKSKQRGAIAPLLPEEIDYFKAWAKDQAVRGKEAVQNFLSHVTELGEDVGRWRVGLSSQLKPHDVDRAVSTGIANQVQEREALQGIIDEIEPTKGKNPEYWQAKGESLVKKGVDPKKIVNELHDNPSRPMSGDDYAVMLAGKADLLKKYQEALADLHANPTNEGLKVDAKAAKDQLQTFLTGMQLGKGHWSDMGRAMQAGVELDTGNYADVLMAVAKKQGVRVDQIPEGMAKRYEQPVRKVSETNESIIGKQQELKAEKQKAVVQTFRKTTKEPYSRDQYRKEVTDAFAEFRKSLASTAGAANDVLRVGGELTKEAGALIYKVGWATAKLGVHEAESLVGEVRRMLKSEFGEDVSRQEVIDNMSTSQRKPVTKTEIQKKIVSLSQELKRMSTGADATKRASAEARIKTLKEALSKGEYRVESKTELKLSSELEQLMAEKKFYEGQVRSMLAKEGKPAWVATAGRVAGGIRSLTLAEDIGVLTRQALFMNPINNPTGFAKGLAAGVKALRSDKVLASVMRDLEERRIAGHHMGAIRKKYGLSLSDPHIHQEEIASLHELGNAGRWISDKFEKNTTMQHIGAVPGSLERFQTAFLNTARAEAFDRAYAMGMSDSELKLRAEFINAVGGRSGAKGVPEALSILMTSPRYERSRWETMLHGVKNPVILGKSVVQSLAEGKGLNGVNRAAAINTAQMAATAAEVYGLFKLAETAGYKVNWDPKSGDFLKMRRGNEVWDVSAGMAPRLRDVLRFAMVWDNPEYKNNIVNSLGAAAVRTASPGVRIPAIMSSAAWQSAHGRPPKDLISGFAIDETNFTDWRGLLPMTAQAFWQATQEPASSPFWSFFREFVGSGVNFYPESGTKSKKNPVGNMRQSIKESVRPRL